MTQETEEKKSPHTVLPDMSPDKVDALQKYATLPNLTENTGPNFVDVQAGDPKMAGGDFFRAVTEIAQDTKMLDTALRSSPSIDQAPRRGVSLESSSPKANS